MDTQLQQSIFDGVEAILPEILIGEFLDRPFFRIIQFCISNLLLCNDIQLQRRNLTHSRSQTCINNHLVNKDSWMSNLTGMLSLMEERILILYKETFFCQESVTADQLNGITQNLIRSTGQVGHIVCGVPCFRKVNIQDIQ